MLVVQSTILEVTKIISKDDTPEEVKELINKFNEAEGNLLLEVTPCIGDDLEMALLLGDYEYIFPKNNPYSYDLRVLFITYDDVVELDVDL